ncbi:hypothetical protein Tco_0518186 [Tanacetum coccineum]
MGLIGTDFESWQQRIRLYCLGKDNGENIIKSITEGPFQMGTMRDTLTEGGEGALHLGPERARVFADLSAEQKEGIKLTFVLRIFTTMVSKRLINTQNHFTDAKDIWDNVKMILEGSELTKDDRESQLYDEFEQLLSKSKDEETIHVYYVRNKATVQDGRVVVQDVSGRYNANNQGRPLQRNNARRNVVAGIVGGEQVTNVDDDVDDSPEDDLALNVDHVFEADQCDAFDSDVDEAPTIQTIWKMTGKASHAVPKPLSALTVYPPNTSCVTEGERGFEQTKRCYLTEVIPFFKTLKEHFAGVQTALFKEVKVMEEIFDQMNDEVDQNTVDKQCAEIVKKNLLIENENLIANCLSNQLLYDVEKSRCLDLEAEMSKVHNESKHISKLEREYLNLQLKYQHLQESFDNNKSQTSQEAPDFNSFFKIKNLEHQIQEKDNVIRDLKVLVANVNDRSCETYNAKDVTALIEQNECVRVELEKVKQHYKELYDSIKITRAHTSEKTSTMLNEIESLKAQLRSKVSCFTSDFVKPKVLAPGMYAIDVKPIPHPLKNNRSAHLNYISHLKESVETVREIVEEARVVKPLDNALNYACQYTKLSQEFGAI